VEVEGVLSESQQMPARRHRKPFTYVAYPPSDSALLRRGRSLIGLAVNAQIHNVVAADGAVVDDDVPRPERNCIPLIA